MIDLPLSYKAYFSNLRGIEYRYSEKAYYVLFLAFLEMIEKNIIQILHLSHNQLFISKTDTHKENSFSLYTLLLRPLENNKSKMELNKYIFRIGIYGYSLTNIFSKHSIKNVILKELLNTGILIKRGIWPFRSYKLKYKLEEPISTIDFKEEKKKLISNINVKINFSSEELNSFLFIVNSELKKSTDSLGVAINTLGK